MEENATALNAQENEAPKQEILDSSTNYMDKSLSEILALFTEMLERGDQQEIYKNAEVIKASFYKVLRREKMAAGLFVQPGAQAATSESANEGDEDAQANPFDVVEKAFKDIYAKYKVSRSSYIKEIQKAREENFNAKLAIIDEINQLLEKAEDVNQTFPAFRELQARWKAVGSVPQEKAKDLWDQYNHAVEKFYDYIKINNEFRDLDFKKNLEAKEKLCEKAEALVEDKDAVQAFYNLQKLHEEWKELGPVAKEERESIWARFKEATSKINKKHQEYFDNQKEEQKKNFELKSALCEKAEEIASTQSDESSLWNSLSKKMEALQAEWKGIGFASKKENQKIYDRFRAACDKFYDAKREYYAKFKDVMQDNLKKKEELCEAAEKIKESTEWKKATDQLINLQKQWKTIGPVTRKQSDAVWKRFRAACDEFFENKAKHYGAEDQKFEDNLKAKLALIEEIKAYQPAGKEADEAALEEFHNKWNAIGYVPFKEKASVQKEFDAALNLHFADIRDAESEKKMGRIRRLIADAKSSGRGERGIRAEREKLLNKFHKIESDIATLENNMGFFAKSKNAEKLIEDLKKKIANGKEELKQLEQKIKMIDKEF
ncbi:MAG: DUF349 domain-containing protein [Candidatus Egerieousia sp.]